LSWLSKRLGCAGRPSRRILGHLSELVPALPDSVGPQVGLSADELERLCAEFQLEELTRYLGLTGGIVECAWWGSALGDIALSTRTPPGGENVLQEAALFHLGFQLFDVVVDTVPAHKRELASALRPELLKTRLLHPVEPLNRLHSEDRAVALIVRLFDAALSSAGQRLCGDETHATYAGHLLERMYASELQISPDLFAAKRLPVVFLGVLAIHPSNVQATALFAHLSLFLSLWDDWADLSEDMLQGAPNAFLSSTNGSRTRRTLEYAARSVTRVAAGRAAHGDIVTKLREPLSAALALGVEFGPESHAKIVAICRHLIRNES